MKKFLILQIRPEDEAADSEFAAILRKGRLPESLTERIRVHEEDLSGLDLGNYCAVIAGGSPFDVSTPREEKSPVQNHVEATFNHLFDIILRDDIPFLGICSGNGLLGSYCGTTISKKYGEPVGGVKITTTDEGAIDPLLEGLPNEFEALVGHKEACDELPEGATLLASSKGCPIQMFRLKKNIYATQFHPEADAEEFSVRVDAYKEFGYFPPEEAVRLKKMLQGLETPEANNILKSFVNRYKNR